jgi:alpha-methylacyl-CoA racemase
MSLIHSLRASGLWQDRREANLIDGGAPFYRCYRTSDDKFMAVGAIEPQFFALLIDGLGADPGWAGRQYDQTAWPEMETEFADRFRTRSREEWTAQFEATDACVSPVLDMAEAPHHPHNTARETFRDLDGYMQPAPAPRFASGNGTLRRGAFFQGEDTRDVLAAAGFDADRIAEMIAAGQVEQAQ